MRDVMFVSFTKDLHLIFDKIPDFDIVVLRYGDPSPYLVPCMVRDIIDVKTECKADIIYHSLKYLKKNYINYGYVGFFDDDVSIKVSQYENCLKIARENNLALFAPSLSPESNHSHKHTLNDGSNKLNFVPWVEVMMPTMSKTFIDMMYDPFIKVMDRYNFKSGWGIDAELFPDILRRTNGLCGVIHQEVVSHKRPITSPDRIYSNNLSSWDEWELWKELVRNNYVFTPEPIPSEEVKIGKIAYINLDKRRDKRYKMETELNKITSVPHERFSGICPDFQKDIMNPNGKYHPLRKRFAPRVDWSINDKNPERVAGFVGCFVSHYELYKKLYEEGHEYALVLEDDCAVTEEHLKYIRGMISENRFPMDWDIIRDGWFLSDRGPYKFPIPHWVSKEGMETANTHDTCGGTHYVLLNCKKIPKILNRLDYDYIYDIDAMLNSPSLNTYFMKLRGTNFIGGSSDIPKTTNT
jgi:GR25 family glycosyltransferase involved in LPS biosynthesis